MMASERWTQVLHRTPAPGIPWRPGVRGMAGWGHGTAPALARGARAGLGWGPRLAVLFFGLSVLLSVTLWLADLLLRDAIAAWAESKAVNMASRAIAMAVAEGLAEEMEGVELATPIVDGDGRIVGFQYAMAHIGRLEAAATARIQDKLQELAQERLPVPVGQLTGLHWLAGWGPPIPVRMVPTGHVRTSPRSEFRAAGINQVLHRIYVDVEVNMRVVAPLIEADLPVRRQIPLSERVFMGQVPHMFVQWSGGDLHDLPAGTLLPALK